MDTWVGITKAMFASSNSQQHGDEARPLFVIVGRSAVNEPLEFAVDERKAIEFVTQIHDDELVCRGQGAWVVCEIGVKVFGVSGRFLFTRQNRKRERRGRQQKRRKIKIPPGLKY